MAGPGNGWYASNRIYALRYQIADGTSSSYCADIHFFVVVCVVVLIGIQPPPGFDV